MAIFTNDRFDSEIIACEGYEYSLGGNYDAMMESCEDDFAIIEAMHAFDMAEMEIMKESGSFDEPQPVLEASIKEIWEKIKAFFVNLGKKIAAFFKSVGDYIASIVMSGSEFAKKYKARLSGLKLNGFTYDMYNYTINDNFTKGKSIISKTNKEFGVGGCKAISDLRITEKSYNVAFTKFENEYTSKIDDVMANMRKALSGTTSEEEFSKALFNMFRGGGKKQRISIGSTAEYVSYLEKSSDLLKHIKDTEKNIKDEFKNIETSINKAAAEAEKDAGEGWKAQAQAKKASLMRNQLSAVSKIQSMTTRYINAWTSAAKEATGVYKNVCFKAMQYKAD